MRVRLGTDLVAQSHFIDEINRHYSSFSTICDNLVVMGGMVGQFSSTTNFNNFIIFLWLDEITNQHFITWMFRDLPWIKMLSWMDTAVTSFRACKYSELSYAITRQQSAVKQNTIVYKLWIIDCKQFAWMTRLSLKSQSSFCQKLASVTGASLPQMRL